MLFWNDTPDKKQFESDLKSLQAYLKDALTKDRSDSRISFLLEAVNLLLKPETAAEKSDPRQQYLRFFHAFQRVEIIVFLHQGINQSIERRVEPVFKMLVDLMAQYYWQIRAVFDSAIDEHTRSAIFLVAIPEGPEKITSQNMAYLARLRESESGESLAEQAYQTFIKAPSVLEYRQKYLVAARRVSDATVDQHQTASVAGRHASDAATIGGRRPSVLERIFETAPKYLGCKTPQEVATAKQNISNLMAESYKGLPLSERYTRVVQVLSYFSLSPANSKENISTKFNGALMTLYFRMLNELLHSVVQVGISQVNLYDHCVNEKLLSESHPHLMLLPQQVAAMPPSVNAVKKCIWCEKSLSESDLQSAVQCTSERCVTLICTTCAKNQEYHCNTCHDVYCKDCKSGESCIECLVLMEQKKNAQHIHKPDYCIGCRKHKNDLTALGHALVAKCMTCNRFLCELCSKNPDSTVRKKHMQVDDSCHDLRPFVPLKKPPAFTLAEVQPEESQESLVTHVNRASVHLQGATAPTQPSTPCVSRKGAAAPHRDSSASLADFASSVVVGVPSASPVAKVTPPVRPLFRAMFITVEQVGKRRCFFCENRKPNIPAVYLTCMHHSNTRVFHQECLQASGQADTVWCSKCPNAAFPVD